jgi:hypothetical protein
MPARTWVLTDVQSEQFQEHLCVGADDVDPAMQPFCVQKRTLRGGLRDGVEVVDLYHPGLGLRLVPTRGLGLWKAFCPDGAGGDVQLGWKSPTLGPVHPQFVPQDEPSGIGWLRGFDEFLVRCGLNSNGAPEWDAAGKLVHPLHGRIANLPAHYVAVKVDPADQSVEITGMVDESRFFADKLRLTSRLKTIVGSRSFTVTDSIRNLSTAPGELELLYHINQGPPLASPGSKFFAPVQTLVPKDSRAASCLDAWQTYPAASFDPEIVLFFELIAGDDGWTKVLLQNPAGDRGLVLSFDRRQFPLFTLWKNPLPEADGYVTGLEPCINLPHGKSFEKSQGRVAVLQPGETRQFELRFDVLTTADEVNRTRDEIAALQRTCEPKIYDAPQPGWSP